MDETNPYQPPRAGGLELKLQAPLRRRWIAAALAVVITPAVAMLYVGRWQRAVVYLAALILTLPVAMTLAGLGVRFSVVAMAVSLGLLIGGAVDSARLAKPDRLPAPMPWYSRRPAFPIIAVACFAIYVCIRLFGVQPYQIPSGAMIPSLLVGDTILVSRNAYGLRVPGIDTPLVGGRMPAHGDVIVFHYPEKPELDYVKRLIGLPGDTVEYREKRLSINGKELPQVDIPGSTTGLASGYAPIQTIRETHGHHTYSILHNPDQRPIQLAVVRDFPHREQCAYSDDGFRCVVPDGHYFVMGDNRDSSSDSRYWGFVPDANLVGRVLVVLCSNGRVGRMLAEVP